MNQVQKRLFEATDQSSRCPALLGTSAAIRRARSAVRVAARTKAPVLIKRGPGCLGETVAQTIHRSGDRRDALFERIECGSPGAPARVRRFLDNIDPESRITLFLDRVDRLGRTDQANLARAFDQGGLGAPDCGVRILTGVHNEPMDSFRQDLYFHLSVLIVEMPPLCWRAADIQTLFSYHMGQVAAASHRPVPAVSRGVIDLCNRYHWPGNIRELRCVVERLVASSRASTLGLSGLPHEIRHPGTRTQAVTTFKLPPEGLRLEDLERDLIRQALAHQGGNRTRAARLLGLSRQTLLYRMKKHGLR